MERPYQDMSDDDLAGEIENLRKMGLNPTSSVIQGLQGQSPMVEESDYVSPGGKRGLTVRQPPEDVLANAIRVAKKGVESDAAIRKGYWDAMGQAEQQYNKSIADSSAIGNKDRLERDLQDIESRLRGYGGGGPGTKSLYAKWAGAAADVPNTQDEGYQNLLREKYAIQNALMGKGVDIKEAVPQKRVGGGQLIPGPGGSLLQIDETGKVNRVLDREKVAKPVKKTPNSLEVQKYKQALKILDDPLKVDQHEAAQSFLDAMDQKYGDIVPERNGEEPTVQAKGITSKKKVVRTGTDKKTGRKVIQYEDGTMSYAD